MSNEESSDIIIEALEVFLNHILYVREVYPTQIFKIRRIYNIPIYVSIFPPLNTYLCKILTTARELRHKGELHRVEVLLYRGEDDICERYNFEMFDMTEKQPPECAKLPPDDEFLIEFEEQLRTSLALFSERAKTLPKLSKDVKFKVLLHTTQSGFVRLSHNPHYQDFPWLRETLRCETPTTEVLLLPLTTINAIGLHLVAEVF